MKTTIYINKEGAPMVHPVGWPKAPQAMLTTNTLRLWAAYNKCMKQAKSEAVYFDEGSDKIFKTWLQFRTGYKNTPVTPDTFIEAEIGEVEICYQRAFSPMLKGYRFKDVSQESYENYSGPYAQRKVARIINAKHHISNPCKYCEAKENQDCRHWDGNCLLADEDMYYEKQGTEVEHKKLETENLSTGPLCFITG